MIVGQKVIILKMPKMSNESKTDFYDLFKIYDNICFGFGSDEDPFIVVTTDYKLAEDIKMHKEAEGVIEISKKEIPAHNEDTFFIKGNFRIWPL
jgi:hypothetical protein